ncbi:mitochondrial fission ELM1 family protein [Acuticoccus kandeliae]|uniref:mitochondrial fission ELM1 family protein n=1 Tax=Acuticoccus kandeliae TaxID=2073160 RepID=UPI00196AFEF3|nr:mitochondrial fission ELM1 family protein [Acuticoccus kandeliae]
MSRCLIISAKGKKGHERQALAIARRLGLETTIRTVDGREDPDAVWADVAAIAPALVIGAGRQSLRFARAIARRPAPRPCVAVLQPVLWRPNEFDFVWAPLHDRTSLGYARRNRLETLTAPSAVTPEERREGAAWIDTVRPDLSPPRVGVLIGGASRSHRFGPDEAHELAARLAAFADTHDASLLVTTSRRTGAAQSAILRETLADGGALFVDAMMPQTSAPVGASIAYAGILEKADAFVVTADSFAMLSDVVATGKPAYGWRLPGGKAKFDTFYDGLVEHGAMQWFDGSLKSWKYDPLDAADTIADTLRASLGLLEDAQDRI